VCFGLGFFTQNTPLYKWCIPLLYSQALLIPSLGYATAPTTTTPSMLLKNNFCLESSAYQIPHPEKAYTGGEDAYFTHEDNAVGVADGVGGWASVGVDSSIYSNALMKHAKSFFSSKQVLTSNDPATDSLQFGYEQCKSITGSSTGVVAAVVGSNIKLCNVGDSKAILFRLNEDKQYKVQAFTKEQTYKFNFPYQLGTGSDSSPKLDGEKYEWSLQDGDVLILASDGVTDNLWNEDIAAIINSESRSSPLILAQKISRKTFEIAEDSYSTTTPWAVGAKAAGKRGGVWVGGKVDDITVVVSKVSAKPISEPSSKL